MIPLLLMYSTHAPSAGHCARLEKLGCTVTVARHESEAIRLAADAEVVCGHRYLRQSLPAARRLRWVHSTAGGVERLPLRELSARGVLLSRSVCMTDTIARHAIVSAWAVTRGLPHFVRRQAERRWDPGFAGWLPRPARAVVIGTGAIGGKILHLLRGEGVHAEGVNRSRTDWRALVAESDWVFLALPLTPATRMFLDEDAIRSMKSTAVFVLAGRAGTVDFDALCAALRAGRLGGAAVDLLPDDWQTPEHPVWETPRLLITPHVAAHAAERPALLEREAEHQVARFLAGKSPEHLVDLSALAA